MGRRLAVPASGVFGRKVENVQMSGVCRSSMPTKTSALWFKFSMWDFQRRRAAKRNEDLGVLISSPAQHVTHSTLLLQ